MADVPEKVIREQIAEFNDFYDLRGSRRMLWELFRAATVSNFSSLSEIERDDLATFYERMDNLLETIHAIGKQMTFPSEGGSHQG